MEIQEFSRPQSIITSREDYCQTFCQIAKEQGVWTEAEIHTPGRWLMRVCCDQPTLSGLNEATCKAMLPKSADWQVERVPDSGSLPFVDVYEPADDPEEAPIARLFLM